MMTPVKRFLNNSTTWLLLLNAEPASFLSYRIVLGAVHKDTEIETTSKSHLH